MTTTTISARPRDLIAYVWYHLGYRPRESLVLVGLHGSRHRAGAVARADLPPPGGRGAALQGMARILHRAGDDAVVVLVISDTGGDPRPGPDGTPRLAHRGLVRQLRRELPRSGLQVVDVIGVGPTAFRSHLCSDPGCCPARGTPLSQVAASQVAATMVFGGASLLPDEESVIADVKPGPAPVARSGPGGEPGWGGPADRTAALARWRELVVAGDPDPGPLPGLLDALVEPSVRDALLLCLVPGSGELPERVLAGADGMVDLAGVLSHRPDPDLAERGRRVLSAAARYAPAGRRADPLAVLAWLAWWRGNGTRGRLLAMRALADVPGHRLAVLVTQLLAEGVPPPWLETAD